MLADLLKDLASQVQSQDQGAVRAPDGVQRVTALDEALDDARAVITAAAEEAKLTGGWSPEEPLRLTKNRVRWLLHCPRRAVAADDGPHGPHGNMADLLLGVIVDAAAKLLALNASRPVAVDSVVAFLDAQGEDQVSTHLADIGESATSELLDEAAVRLEQLNALWPDVDPEWWPRVEEPLRVPLADRSVVLSGRLDILLGGSPAQRPGVIIEVKGGRWHDSARSETHFYSLLLGLRDGIAPTHVVSLAAADGATHVEDIRPAILNNVARQVATAMETASSITAGEVPVTRPGAHCATCPLLGSCPAAAAQSAEQPAAA